MCQADNVAVFPWINGTYGFSLMLTFERLSALKNAEPVTYISLLSSIGCAFHIRV